MLFSAQSIAVTRAGREILHGVSLAIDRGEIVAVVGPNGAGKSTLLSAILGAIPHGGSITIDGRKRSSFEERAREIAYVPDGMMMPDETTLGLALDVDPRARWVERLGVSSLLRRRASATSRGELERAALAAALDLAHRDAGRMVMLLDEPFSSLDPAQVRDVVPIVREACAERAALVTVHQLSVAERVADRIALLVRGRLVAIGTAAELRERARVSAQASLEDAFLALLDETPTHATGTAA
jgi:iron complex transport system ATP-binding protein